MTQKAASVLAGALFFCVITAFASGQANSTRMQNGLRYYSNSQWKEALTEFRAEYASTVNSPQKAEALFWIAMAELNSGSYTAAAHDFDGIEFLDSANSHLAEIPYNKARALYYLGRYTEALALFRLYAESVNPNSRLTAGIRSQSATTPDSRYVTPYDSGTEEYNKKASALYWIAECLYALGQYSEAELYYATIVDQYPWSYKFEASTYRVALIQEKKRQDELINTLKISGDQSALTAMQNSQQTDYSAYQSALAEALKTNLTTPAPVVVTPSVPEVAQTPDQMNRLLSLKNSALDVMDQLLLQSMSGYTTGSGR
jgi:TolA-binding protein